MKTINTYIFEKLKINKKTITSNYNYHPIDKLELIHIIEDKINNSENIDNIDFNDIDTSEINDMAFLFKQIKKKYPKLRKFDVSKWDVSNVEDMEHMFYSCEDFNCDLSKWNVSKCTNMSSMFKFCYAFKGKGIDNWDVSNVEDFRSIFSGCRNFNQNLSSWNLSKAKYIENMFHMCIRYEGIGIEDWNVSNVENFNSVFYGCKKFNSDISKWDVSNGTNFIAMFAGCEKLENCDFEDWDISKVSDIKDIKWMFNNCPRLKKPSWYR